MKRKLRWTSLYALTAAIAITHGNAGAQGIDTYASAISAGFFAGGSIPTGELTDFADSGWHIGGLVRWDSRTSPFGFRFDVAYHDFGAKENRNDNLSMIIGTLNGLLSFPLATTTIRPYLTAGAGIYNERCHFCNSQTKPGVNGGLGIVVAFSGLAAMIESRAHLVFDSEEGVSNSVFIPISVGLLFR